MTNRIAILSVAYIAVFTAGSPEIVAQDMPRLATGHDQASNRDINLGRVMWSAFPCATYAEMSEDLAEQERLFEVGYEAGRAFLTSVEEGTISDEELQRSPTVVLLLLGGPTIDFILGRIFQSAADNAYDNVVKRDLAGGLITNPSEWAEDELAVERAKTKFHQSNCAVVR
jgi:hypothetical protein